MKKTLLLAVLSFILAACSASEQTTAGPQQETMEELEGITVINVRANMTLPSDTGSIWMEIHNNTDEDDALTGADFEGCQAIELHNMVMDNDVMIMREVEGGRIPIPAGGKVELKQGGLHVMCIGKEAPLEAGSTLGIVLQFANAGPIEVTADVVAPGDMGVEMEMGDGG